MHDEMMNNPHENNDEVQGIKIVPEKRKNPINKILIGLILILAVLLALQLSNMNNVEDVILEPEIPEITTPTVVELKPELFDSETILLDFADITLSLQTDSIRDYYENLTDDMSNFVLETEFTIVPSENIFEMKFQESQTCIYFYDRIKEDQSYITVMHEGKIVGTYLIPVTYYGNLYNVVYAAEGVTEHTKETISAQLADIAAEHADVAVMLDEQHDIVDKQNKISVFDAKVKSKESASIVYCLNNEKLVIVTYMNLRYYVYLTELDGTVVKEAVYNHYTLHNDGKIMFYNDEVPVSVENFYMDETGLAMRVG